MSLSSISQSLKSAVVKSTGSRHFFTAINECLRCNANDSSVDTMPDNDQLVYHTADYVAGLTDELNMCHKRVDELMQEVGEFESQLGRDIERMHAIDTRTNAVLQALQAGTFDETKQRSELETLMREYDELTQLDNATLRYTEVMDELILAIDVIIDIESELACDAAADATTRKRHAEEVQKYTQMREGVERRDITRLG